MQINILGCGSSVGVPVIGCKCPVCTSQNSKNIRLRSAILISTENKDNILIDFGADMKQQFIKYDICNLSAAILTHDHADHVNGIDDLKIFSFINKSPLPVYSDSITINSISQRFKYMFQSEEADDHWGKNRILPVVVTPEVETRICGLDFMFFQQHHGLIDSLGIRVGNFVYSNDVVAFPKSSEKFLRDIDIWVIDCLHYQTTKAHFGLEDVLKYNEIFQPKQIYLTNMSHSIEYNKIQSDLPKNIMPAYDGMIINI